ncbi:MAG: zinc ribbon domain-containing protein [Candidatus Hermodarchaeota archaeon]
MKLNDPNRKVKVGTIGLWAIFAIVTVVMIALVFGEVFMPYDYWIPIIPIGVLLILSVMATIVDFRSEQRIKIGVIGVWTIFLITTVVLAALILGEVFTPEEYWIPAIPIGTLFVLALIITILEYISGEVRFCHKCGKRFEKKWDFCQECGARVLIACPTCGMKVKGNPKFCYKCGTDLSEIKVEHVYRPPPKPKVDSQANFCRECGSIANPEAKYCGYCGAAHV